VNIILISSNCKFESDIENKNDAEINDLKNPYLGQGLPGETPELFAPGIINTDDQNHSCATISPNGNEDIYWVSAKIINQFKQNKYY